MQHQVVVPEPKDVGRKAQLGDKVVVRGPALTSGGKNLETGGLAISDLASRSRALAEIL
jgi:hypothetical protein